MCPFPVDLTMTSFFSHLEVEPADPIIKVMQQFAADQDPNKIDTTVGVYFDGDGRFATYPLVQAAKKQLAAADPGHNYHTMKGIPAFVRGAREVAFGADRVAGNRIALVQAISGTGALHSAFDFLTRQLQKKHFYVGVPTWGNYFGMVEHVGGQCHTYQYMDPDTFEVDFAAITQNMTEAELGLVFVMQACCHNPTGVDLSHDQWREVAQLAKQRQLVVVLDIAYQGFQTGNLDEDAWPVRHFYDAGLEYVVCQSFSKNLGLYGERVGCLHVVAASEQAAQAVELNLVANFRAECLFAPAWGAYVAATVFGDASLVRQWHLDVAAITARLKGVRQTVHAKLTALGTPGAWSHITLQNGLFWHLGLTEPQVRRLMDKHHVYATFLGRVNVAGLNDANIDRFCAAVDEVSRNA